MKGHLLCDFQRTFMIEVMGDADTPLVISPLHIGIANMKCVCPLSRFQRPYWYIEGGTMFNVAHYDGLCSNHSYSC